MNAGSKYAFELFSPNGTLLADLSGIATNRTFTRSRNEADDISCDIDFNKFHRYCADINTHPRALLIPGQTELRVRRYDKYLAGGQINYAEPDISAQSQVMSIRAAGFLNLFADRQIPFTEYIGQDVGVIARALITDSQAQTNGDFGVTLGVVPASIALANETYNRVSIKQALQDLANSETKGFDMDFTPNKVFNIYTQMGNNRPEARFEFPNNITSFKVPLDATSMANEVVVLGAGIGAESTSASATSDDLIAQVTYKLRQKIVTDNGDDNASGGVQEEADAELAAWSNPIEIPQITVDGNKLPFVGNYDIGDYIWVNLGGYKWFEDFNGLHRIEKYTVAIDDGDNESPILYLKA